jgi:hypothetical protein
MANVKVRLAGIQPELEPQRASRRKRLKEFALRNKFNYATPELTLSRRVDSPHNPRSVK